MRPLVVGAARRVGPSEAQRTLDEWPGAGGAGGLPSLVPREEVLKTYDREWSSEGFSGPEEEARYRSLGRELLLGYYDTMVRDPPAPVAVEEHLEARWDGVPIHGYIDRIDRTRGGGLEILDYKTTRDLTSEDALSSDQLSMYQVLVEKNYPDPVERLTLYHLRSLTPLRAPPRPAEALEELHYRVGTVSDGIRAGAFEPTPGRHCARCDFQALCPEFRPVPGADAARMRELVDRFERLRADERRLEEELQRTAESLHQAAEELGVHRVPGSSSVAIRRREETWQYPTEVVGSVLHAEGSPGRRAPESSEEVRRLLRDASIPAEVRRRVAESGSRKVRWFWELEERENGR